jgi:hypothetical protein
MLKMCSFYLLLLPINSTFTARPNGSGALLDTRRSARHKAKSRPCGPEGGAHCLVEYSSNVCIKAKMPGPAVAQTPKHLLQAALANSKNTKPGKRIRVLPAEGVPLIELS